MHVALDPSAGGASPLDRVVEVGGLEPYEDAVAERSLSVCQAPVVILNLGVVELEQDLAVPDDLLVLVAAVTAVGAEDLLVEAARRGHVAHDEQRLRPDRHDAVQNKRLRACRHTSAPAGSHAPARASGS